MMGRALLAAAAALMPAMPLAAQDAPARPSADDLRARVERAVSDSGYVGVFAVGSGGRRLAGGAAGTTVAGGGDPYRYEMILPLAGLAGDVAATLALQDVAAGRLALDAPASRYLPAAGGRSVRALVAGATGGGGVDCSGARPCDTAALARVVAGVERRPLPAIYVDRIVSPTGMGALFQAGPDRRADASWPGAPDPSDTAVAPGGIAPLVGTVEDALAFDMALLDGTLLLPPLQKVTWQARSGVGIVPQGCRAPVSVSIRLSGTGAMRVLDVLVPDKGIAAVLATGRADADITRAGLAIATAAGACA